MGNHGIINKRDGLIDGTVKLLDNLFYVRDLLCVGKSCLSNLITEKLLWLLVVPIVMQLMKLGESNGVNISAVTSLYSLTRLLQVLDKKEMLDSVALLILYPHATLITSRSAEANAVDNNEVISPSEHLSKMKELLCSSVDLQEVDYMNVLRRALEHNLPISHLIGSLGGDLQERNGIFSYVFSDKLCLQLASLMLLLILAGSEDLVNLLSSIFFFPQTCTKAEAVVALRRYCYSQTQFCNMTDDVVVLDPPEQCNFVGCMPQIFNVLLNVLGSASPSPATHLHVGWLMLKLIYLQRSILSQQELHLYKVITIQLNALLTQARERFLTVLSGYWFDHIPDTFEKEWTHCTTALEESSISKDPFFVLEIATAQQVPDGKGFDAWQKMVDVVKIFVLHLQLKAYLIKGYQPGNPLSTLPRTSFVNPRISDDSDPSARFGSEVSVASGIPCKIAFSKLGLRDIFMIPSAKGISRKLLLLEKHPFHARRGIIFATAPLAGLSPKVDEEQATWLHLHVRELSPNISAQKSNYNSSGCQKDARWTLGFSDTKTCEAANLLIAEEPFKQRHAVESLLAPYLSDSYTAD